MKILNRYILREILFFFAITLLVFTGILLTLRMLKFTSLVINRGVELSQIGMLFVSIIPTFLEIAIPLSALLGVMLALGRLSGDSEVIVMRTSGLSIFALLRPVLLFASCVTIIAFWVTLQISPAGFRSMSRTLFGIASSQSLAGLEPGIFNKLGRLTLYAEEINYENSALSHVLIDDKRSDQARRIVTSKTGAILSNPEDRSIIFALHDGYIHEQIEGKYVLTHFQKNSLVLDPSQMYDPESSKKSGPNPRELTLHDLRERRQGLLQTLAHSEEAQGSAQDLRGKLELYAPELLLSEDKDTKAELLRKIARVDTEINRRFSMPVAALILAVLGLPLGIQVPRTQRTWGVGICAGLGMAVFLIYYGLFSVGVGLAESGSMPVWLALWLPNLVSAVIAIYAVSLIGKERWESIPHALEDFIFGLIARFRTRSAET